MVGYCCFACSSHKRILYPPFPIRFLDKHGSYAAVSEKRGYQGSQDQATYQAPRVSIIKLGHSWFALLQEKFCAQGIYDANGPYSNQGYLRL